MAFLRTEQTRPVRRRHRRLAVATAILASPILVGCGGGSGFQAQTNQIYQPGPGITVRNPGMFLLNAAIVSDGQGNGTLVGALVNQQPHPDALIGAAVTGRGGQAILTKILTTKVDLAPQRPVQFANTSTIRMMSDNLVTGRFYTLTLTFEHAAPIKIQTLAIPNTAEFSNVKIGPLPGGGSAP